MPPAPSHILCLYLPVASNSVNIFLVLGLGGGVGFLAGMFGVGGGFLLTPLMIMIGIPPTIAAASVSNQIIAACVSGTIAHARSGAVDYKMGFLILMGGILGGSIGVKLIHILRGQGQADITIMLVYVIMLAGVGFYMFYDSLTALTGWRYQPEFQGELECPSFFNRVLRRLPYKIYFHRSKITLSIYAPLFLGLLVGILASIMGIGGGFIMVPSMVYLLRMPMHVVVGTNLFQEIFICTTITIMQATLNHTVDFILALILLLGSVIGAQAGAHLSNRLKTDQLKILLSLIILAVMVEMLLRLLTKPDILVMYKGGL